MRKLYKLTYSTRSDLLTSPVSQSGEWRGGDGEDVS